MFRKLLDAGLGKLNVLLNKWVEPVVSQQLDATSLLTGQLDIRSVQLKQKITDFFPIPVNLIFNYIGRVHVSVSLFSLFTHPITVTVENVILVVSTRPEAQWDKTETQERLKDMKKTGLKAGETAAILNKLENGTVWKLAMRIAKNVRVIVKNVHVRFEDRVTQNQKPFAFGLGLRHLELEGGSWSELSDPPPISDKSNLILKKLVVKGFGVYVENINTKVPKGHDLRQPFTPIEEDDRAHFFKPKQGVGARRASSFTSLASPFQNTSLLSHANSASPSRQQDTQSSPPNTQDDKHATTSGSSPRVERCLFSSCKPRGKASFKNDDNGGNADAPQVQGLPSSAHNGNSVVMTGGAFREGNPDSVSFFPNNAATTATFSFDGRVPWRRLLAPFCVRRLYDIETASWVDDENELDENIPPTSTSCPINCSRASTRFVDDEDQTNYYENVDEGGHRIVTVEEADDNDFAVDAQGVPDANVFTDYPNVSRQPFSPAGQRAPLRIRLGSLPVLEEILERLNDAYHYYLIEPRALEALVTLAAVPQVPETYQNRCWSKWGETQCSSKTLKPFPQCRVDVVITGLKIVLADWQTLHMLKWAEYSSQLYGNWLVGLQAENGVPRPSKEEEDRYISEWLKKLLHGEKTEEDVEWCQQFEEKYSLQAINLIRNKALKLLKNSDQDKSVGFPNSMRNHANEPSYFGTPSSDTTKATSPDESSFSDFYSKEHEDTKMSTLSNDSKNGASDNRTTQENSQSSACFFSKAFGCGTVNHLEEDKSELCCERNKKSTHLAALGLHSLLQNDDNLLKELERVRTVRFDAEFALDLTLMDATILYRFGGHNVNVYNEVQYIERQLVVLMSCIHVFMRSQNVSDQQMTLDLEIFPLSVLSTSRSLDSVGASPETLPLLILSYPGAPKSLRSEKNAAEFQRSRRHGLLFWRGNKPDTTDIYKDAIQILKATEPGIFIRMESQLFRTVDAPDMALTVRTTASILLFVIPQHLLNIVKDALPMIDALGQKNSADVSIPSTLASVQAGVAYAEELNFGGIAHRNMWVHVEISSPVNTILLSSDTTLKCEGLIAGFETITLKSSLAPQRSSYSLNLPRNQFFDVYNISLSGLQVKRVGDCFDFLVPVTMYAGGVDLRPATEVLAPASEVRHFKRSLSRHEKLNTQSEFCNPARKDDHYTPVTREVSAIDTLPKTVIDAREPKGSHDESFHNRPFQGDASCAKRQNEGVQETEHFHSSFVLYPVNVETLRIELCHVPTHPEYPYIHVDYVQDELFIDICNYDIELLATIAAQSLETYYSFSNDLQSILARNSSPRGQVLGQQLSSQNSRQDILRPSSETFDIMETTSNLPWIFVTENSAENSPKKKMVRLVDVVKAAMQQRDVSTDALQESATGEQFPHLIATSSTIDHSFVAKDTRLGNMPGESKVYIHAGVQQFRLRLLQKDSSVKLLKNPRATTKDRSANCGSAQDVSQPITGCSGATCKANSSGTQVQHVARANQLLTPSPIYKAPQNRADNHTATTAPSESLVENSQQYFGYHFNQPTIPLLSIVFKSAGVVAHTSGSEVIEFRGGLSDLSILEERNISPVCFSSLYSSYSSFKRPINPPKTRSAHQFKKDFHETFSQTPKEGLSPLFGSLAVRSKLDYDLCPVASLGLLGDHLRVYGCVNLLTKKTELLSSIGSFRIILLWELIDEILCWGTEILNVLPPFPHPPSPLFMTVPPVVVPREFLDVSYSAQSYAQTTENLTNPYDQKNNISMSGSAFIKDSKFTFVQKDNPLSDLTSKNEKEQQSTFSHKEVLQHPPLGYVLRPGMKLGITVAQFEILVPCEPTRVPFKERATSSGFSDRSMRTSLMMSRGSNRYSTPKPSMRSGSGTSATARLGGNVLPLGWKQFSRAYFKRPDRRRLADGEVFALMKLPHCFAIKATLDVKATVFFYVQTTELCFSSPVGYTLPLNIASSCNVELPSKSNAKAQNNNLWDTEPLTFTLQRMSGDAPNENNSTKHDAALRLSSLQKAEESYKVVFSELPNSTSDIENQQNHNDGAGTLVEDDPAREWLAGHGDGLFEEVEMYMKYNPDYFLSALCPCCVKFGLTMSELAVATSFPQAITPLRFPRIDWNHILESNGCLVNPFRFEIDAGVFLPSVRCVYERLHGITPETANLLRRSRGLFTSKYPEGAEAMFNIEPVVVNFSSEACVALYQLFSIASEFSFYAAKKMTLGQPKDAYGNANSVKGRGLDLHSLGKVDSVGPRAYHNEESVTHSHTEAAGATYGTETFLLNFARTFSMQLTISLDLLRIGFWDTFNTQKRCCLSIDVEQLALTTFLVPQRCQFPGIEDFWWHAFNSPRAVFYCSYLSKLVDEPFDPAALENPFARHRRTAKSLLKRILQSRFWSSRRCDGSTTPTTSRDGFARKTANDNSDTKLISTKQDLSEGKNLMSPRQQQAAYRNLPAENVSWQKAVFLDDPLNDEDNPWVSINGQFLMSVDYMNRTEKATYTAIEPWSVDISATKQSTETPASVLVNGSWLNVNVNVALIDAILVYAFSLIGTAVRHRSRLRLDILGDYVKRRKKVYDETAPQVSGEHFSQPQNLDTASSSVPAVVTTIPPPDETGASALPSSAQPNANAGTSNAELTSCYFGSQLPELAKINPPTASPARQGNAGMLTDEDTGTLASPGNHAYQARGENRGFEVLRLGQSVFYFRPHNRFDLLYCLLEAMDVSVLGDAILSKSTAFFNPVSGYTGDYLQAQQLTQGDASQVKTDQPDKRGQTSLAGVVFEAKEKAISEGRLLPHLYNLLGQPIGLYFYQTQEKRGRQLNACQPPTAPKSTTEKSSAFGEPSATPGNLATGCQSTDTAWRMVQHEASAVLATDDIGRTLPFVMRIQLLNFIFDIPSSVLKLDQERLEPVILSYGNHLVEQQKDIDRVSQNDASVNDNGDIQKHTATYEEKKSSSGAGSVQQTSHLAKTVKSHGEPKPLPRSRKPHTGAQQKTSGSLRTSTTTSTSARSSSSQPEYYTFYTAIEGKPIEVRGSWNPNNLPRIRSEVRILIRTSQRVTTGDKSCFDIFLSSALVIRNNTSLGLSIFSTVPGPFEREKKDSVYSYYHTRPPEPPVDVPPLELASSVPAHHRRHLIRRVPGMGAITAGIGDVLNAARGPTAASTYPQQKTATIIYPRATVAVQNKKLFDTREKINMTETDTGENLSSVKPRLNSGNNENFDLHRPDVPDLREQSKSDVTASSSMLQIQYGTMLGHEAAHVVHLQPHEQSVKAIPLYWLAIENASIWIATDEEKLFTLYELHDAVRFPNKTDFIAEPDVFRNCIEPKTMARRPTDLLQLYSPYLIKLYNQKGTALALSSSITLVSPKHQGGAKYFVEFHFDHCFEICNRLPRPLHVKRIGGFLVPDRSASNASHYDDLHPDAGILSPPHLFGQETWGQTAAPTEKVAARGANGEDAGEDILGQEPAEPLGDDTAAELINQESFRLAPGDSVSLPINPDAVIVTIDDQFASKPIPVDFIQEVENNVVQVPLHRVPKQRSHPGDKPRLSEHNQNEQLLKQTGSYSSTATYDSETLARVADEEQDRREAEVQSGLDTLRISVEYSVILNTQQLSTPTETLRRRMRVFTRSATFFADAWVVNRLEYPIRINRFDFYHSVFVPSYSRAIVPTDFVNSQMSLSIETRHMDRIQGIDRYPAKGQAWFFGTQQTLAVSDNFTVADLATKQLYVKRVASYPSLSYSTCMFSAPAPFMRTTIVEILPTFVIYNERTIPLWVREDVYTKSSSILKSETTNMVAYLSIPPHTAIEFHPQLNRTSVRIQISGEPKVEEYFTKVIKPLLKTYYTSYSFQTMGFNRDTLFWSPPLEISHPRVVQVRHPSVPTTASQTCNFTLTEVEVTVKNGSFFVRLMDPNVPEYRLVNLSSRCIAIGQQDHDFFEVLRPVSDSHRRIISRLISPALRARRETKQHRFFSDGDAETREAQDALDFLSLPFSWYNPKMTRKLSMWIVTERQQWKTRQKQATQQGKTATTFNESDICPVSETQDSRDCAFNMVTQARKHTAEQLKDDTLASCENKVSNVSELNSSVNSGPALTVDKTQILVWGRAREHPGFVQPVDLVSLFYNLKQTRNNRKRSAFLIYLKAWLSQEVNADGPDSKDIVNNSPPFPVFIRLRVISGSKVVFFQDYSGEPHTLLHHVFSGTEAELVNSYNCQDAVMPVATREDAFDASISTTVTLLWVKAQHDREALRDLAIILKHNPVAQQQLQQLFPHGSTEAQQRLKQVLEEVNATKMLDRLAQISTDPEQTPQSTAVEQNVTLPRNTTAFQGLAGQAGSVELAAAAVSPTVFNSSFDCHIGFQGFGLSLIDHTPAEFLYVSLANITVVLNLKPEDVRIRTTVGWLQIDNPSDTAYYPTVLRPIIGAVPGASSSFSGAVVKSEVIVDVELQIKISSAPATRQERTLLEVPKVALFLRPLSVNVDFPMLTALLKFVDDILPTVNLEVLSHSVRELQVSEREVNSPEWKKLLGPPIYILDTGAQVDKVFISSFVIGRLAFVMNIRCGDQRGMTQSVEEQPKTEIIRAVLSALNVRASISDAHLVLAQREQKDICGSLDRLAEEIILSYVGLAVGQLHKVLGAIDLLGNPAMVVKHVSSGVENGLLEIKKGLATRRAYGAALGCSNAALSIVTGCAAGAFDFATRCFGSWYGIADMVARNTDKYSLNPNLIKHGGLLDQPRNCCEGTWVGCHSCLLTFGLSFSNILYKPYRGSQLGLAEAKDTNNRRQKYGACLQGCALGGLSGIASVCGLPSSLLLCGQLATSGMLNQLSSVPMLSSVRPRRVFTDGNTKLRFYSAGHAVCGELLRSISENQAISIYVLIDLSSIKSNLTRCEQLKRRLRLGSKPVAVQDFLGLGARRLGFFQKQLLMWHVAHNDIATIEVVALYPSSNATYTSQESTVNRRSAERHAFQSSPPSRRRPTQRAPSVGLSNQEKRRYRASTMNDRRRVTIIGRQRRVYPFCSGLRKRISRSMRYRRRETTRQHSAPTYYLRFLLRSKPTVPVPTDTASSVFHYMASNEQIKKSFTATLHPCREHPEPSATLPSQRLASLPLRSQRSKDEHSPDALIPAHDTENGTIEDSSSTYQSQNRTPSVESFHQKPELVHHDDDCFSTNEARLLDVDTQQDLRDANANQAFETEQLKTSDSTSCKLKHSQKQLFFRDTLPHPIARELYAEIVPCPNRSIAYDAFSYLTAHLQNEIYTLKKR